VVPHAYQLDPGKWALSKNNGAVWGFSETIHRVREVALGFSKQPSRCATSVIVYASFFFGMLYFGLHDSHT
jgi:hypothetical protein